MTQTASPRMLAALLVAGQSLETAQKSEREAGAARGSVGTSSPFEDTLMAVWLWARHEHHTGLELFSAARALGWRYLLEASLDAVPETLDPDSTQPFCAALLLWAAKAEAELSTEPSSDVGRPARLAMGDLAADALRRLLVRSAGAGPKTTRCRGRFDEGFWVWSLAEFARATGDERGLRVATNHVDHFFGTGSLPSPLEEPSEAYATERDVAPIATAVHSEVTAVGPAPDRESAIITGPQDVVEVLPTRAVSTAPYGAVPPRVDEAPSFSSDERTPTGEAATLLEGAAIDEQRAESVENGASSGLGDDSDQLLSTSATRGLATLSVLGVTPFAGLWVRERALGVLPESYLAEGRSPSWNASIAWLLGYIHGQRLLPIPKVRDRYERIVAAIENALMASGYRATPFDHWSLAMAFETMAKEPGKPTRNAE